MEEVSFPIEQDGEKENDHHDRGPDDRDPPAGDKRVEEEARNGQAGRPFLDGDGEEQKFRTLHDPEEQEKERRATIPR